MARTSITTARYNPFTMEELYSPVLRATEKHLEQQEKYDELANQAMIWQYRLNKENDPESYALYEQFNNQMNTMVDDLNTNGILSPSARDNFSSLRRNNPLPLLEENYKRLNELNDMRANNPDAVWIEGTPTMDKLLKGNIDNSHQSLESIRQSGALLGSNFAKGLVDEPSFKPILGGKFYQEKNQQGIPMNVLLALQNQNPEGLSVNDAKLYNDLYNASDKFLKDKIDKFGNYSAIDQARMKSAFWEGMTSGAETTKYSNLSNPGYESRGARIAADINQFKYDEMVANKDRIDRLSTGKATPEDKWWARSNGFDPDTGTPLSKSGSKSSSSSGGSSSDHIHNYAPIIMKSDGTVVTDNASINALRKVDSEGKNNSQYKQVLFTELPTKYQKKVLRRMGYTKEEQDKMFVPAEGKNSILDEGVQFVGSLDLSPDFLNKFLSVEINPANGDMYTVGKSWNTSAYQGQDLPELWNNTLDAIPSVKEEIERQEILQDSTAMQKNRELFE